MDTPNVSVLAPARREAVPPIAAVCTDCGTTLTLDYRRYGRGVSLVYCCPRNDSHAGRRYVSHDGGAA